MLGRSFHKAISRRGASAEPTASHLPNPRCEAIQEFLFLGGHLRQREGHTHHANRVRTLMRSSRSLPSVRGSYLPNWHPACLNVPIFLRKIRSKPKCKFANISVIGFGRPVRYETTGDSRLMGRTPVAQTVA